MAAQMLNILTRAVCWTAGVVDGMLEALLGALSGDQLSRIGPTQIRLAPLRNALLGRHRRQIAKALGTPPAVWAGAGGARPRTPWDAKIWYYPIDPARRQAIAIRFEKDRAKKVELIHGPA